MAKKKVKAKIGDIFRIPVNENLYSYGQLVDENCYVVFDMVSSNEEVTLEEIVKKPIVFLTHTVDVKIEDGDWPLLGSLNIPFDIEFPEYKVLTPSGEMVTDFTGKIIRKASAEDVIQLRNYKSYSPSVLEKAVRAKFGGGEWYPYIYNLIYSKTK